MMKKFKIGKKYSFRIGEDFKGGFIEITKRTKSFISYKTFSKNGIVLSNGDIKRRKVKQSGNSEYIYPEANYTWAPVCYAEKII